MSPRTAHRASPGTLIDDFMPTYDVVERHRTRVAASPAAVYGALRSADLSASPVVRALLAVRALPAVLRSPREAWRRRRRGALRVPVRLADFETRGFVVLAESPPRELVIGLEGRFWTARGDIRATDAAAFRGPIAPGVARAAWNFRVESLGGGVVELSTETRVRCADRAAARRFRAYWLLVRPGSGLIRHCMLAAVRREAEQAEAARH